MPTNKRNTVWVLAAVTILAAAVIAASVSVNRLSVLERAALVGTALAPFLIVASAYLVLMQVKEAARAVRGQQFDATAGRILELSRIFVDHPELRPYFYEGRDIEAMPEPARGRVMSIAELHLDFLDSELLRTAKFGEVIGDLPSFEPWIRGLFRTSPAICRVIHEDSERGQEGWYDAVHKIYRAVELEGSAAWVAPDVDRARPVSHPR